MTSQSALFHEDFRDALRHVVKAMGGVEAVGADLWPAKSRRAAGAWLSDCLNPERAAKLDLDDVVLLLRLGRERGIHCAMHQLADDAGYVQPEIAPQRTREQELADEMQRTLDDFRRIADEAAALRGGR